MYQAKINPAQLNSVLACCPTEYVDVIIRNGVISFINYTSQLFGCYFSECQHTRDAASELSFRIDRKLLQTLCSPILQIEEMNQNDIKSIKITFLDENGAVLYSDSFTQQVVFSSTYQDRLELIQALKGNGAILDLHEVKDLIKMCKSVSGIVNFSDNAVCMEDSGLYIYKRIDTHGVEFSVLADTLWTVSSLNSKVSTIKNYVVAHEGNVYLMATKCRFSSNEFLTQLEEMKSRYIGDVNLSNVFLVYNKIKSHCDNLVIDLENNECNIPVNKNNLTITVSTKNERFQGDKPKVHISATVVKLLCLNAKNGNIQLSVKKRFKEIKQGNLIIFTN